ncbi:hypothetical protein ABIB27_001222 [Arthrobacter sp. UYEF21]
MTPNARLAGGSKETIGGTASAGVHGIIFSPERASDKATLARCTMYVPIDVPLLWSSRQILVTLNVR